MHSIWSYMNGEGVSRRDNTNLNLLMCGGVQLPPPIGGLARRVINHSKVLCERGVNIYLLFTLREKLDSMGVHFNLHYVLETSAKESKKRYVPIFLINLPKQLFFAFRHPFFTLKTVYDILKLVRKGSFTKGWFAISILYIQKIVDLVKKEDIKVICTYYATESSFLAIKAAKLCKKPVIIETFAETLFIKDKPEDVNKAEIYKPLFKYIFSNVDYVVAPSKHCLNGAKQYITRKNIPAKVVISGIDLDKLFVNADKEEQKGLLGYRGNKLVLFVNRLDWTKGPQYLIQASSTVIKEMQNVMFIFIGRDAGMKSYLQRIVKQEGLGDHIVFKGVVPDEELKRYYAAADVLVFPSTTERECMGMSMKEAMASGTPVIAFNAGGAPEAIECGVSGYVVSVGDVDGLEQALVRILSDDELWRNMTNSARRRALELFDKNRTGDDLCSILLMMSEK